MFTEINDNAAFEAHMAAAEFLKQQLGRTASPAEVACALAKAYGDALALVGAATENGAEALVAGINTVAQDAYRNTLRAVAADSFETAP